MDCFLLDVFFGLLDYLFVLLDVFTIATNAVLVAGFTVSEAFAVHFEAEGFFAGASDTFFFTRAGHGLGFL